MERFFFSKWWVFRNASPASKYQYGVILGISGWIHDFKHRCRVIFSSQPLERKVHEYSKPCFSGCFSKNVHRIIPVFFPPGGYRWIFIYSKPLSCRQLPQKLPNVNVTSHSKKKTRENSVEVQICSNLNVTSVKIWRILLILFVLVEPPKFNTLPEGSPLGAHYLGRMGSSQDVTRKWSDHPHWKKPWSKRPFGRGTRLGDPTNHHGY